MLNNNKKTVKEAWEIWIGDSCPDEISQGDNFIDFEAGWKAGAEYSEYIIEILETAYDMTVDAADHIQQVLKKIEENEYVN